MERDARNLAPLIRSVPVRQTIAFTGRPKQDMEILKTPQMESWKWDCYVKKETESEEEEYRSDLPWEDFAELVSEGKVTRDSWVRWQGLAGSGMKLGDLLDYPFAYERQGEVVPVADEGQLHLSLSEGRLTPDTKIWGKNLPSRGVPYKHLYSLDITFSPGIPQFIADRKGKWLTVLSGPNNSGKSLLLKLMHQELGATSLLLACNRFYHFSDLPYASNEVNLSQLYLNSVQQFYQSRQNQEQSSYPLQQIISNLPDERRDTLFRVCSETFGEPFEIIPRRPDTRMTQYYVSVGGVELSCCSTGTRLFLLLLSALMSSEHRTVLIDEPELGLSPLLQRQLAGIMYNDALRQELFPNISSLYIVTHSHHFLARRQLDANFAVKKEGSDIMLTQIADLPSYHDLVIRMLGDDLSSLFLPETIVLAEGPSDAKFLQKVLSDRIPERELAVVDCGGDGRVSPFFDQLTRLFPDFHRSPYRTRTFIVLDAVNSVKERAFTRAGIPASNVVRLSMNGIEYYYPRDLLARVFGMATLADDEIVLEKENVIIGGVTKKKVDVAKDVVALMSHETDINEEIAEKVVVPIVEMLREQSRCT